MARRQPLIGGLCGLIMLAGLPLFAEAGPKPKTHLILISGFEFKPKKLTVLVGDTVMWTNKDIVPHTSTGKKFDSKGIDPGKSWSMKVKKKGTFPYICTYHPSMSAVLIVK